MSYRNRAKLFLSYVKFRYAHSMMSVRCIEIGFLNIIILTGVNSAKFRYAHSMMSVRCIEIVTLNINRSQF